MQELADAAQAVLQNRCASAQVRAIEAGGAPQALWQPLEAAGFADALLPESAGGSGLRLEQVFALWALCGQYLLPLPLAETMLARALLHQAGSALPPCSIALAQGHRQADGSVQCANVHLGRVAGHVLVQHAQGWLLLAAQNAASHTAAYCLDARMHWAQVPQQAAVPLQLPGSLDIHSLRACILAAHMAGALLQLLQRTLQYANTRVQFGRPIGKFQAVQHQCAVMSEHVYAAHMAAHLGCTRSAHAAQAHYLPDPLRAAIAKARCSQAALAACEAAHAVHGAIGFTAEYDVQLYTRRLHAWCLAAGSQAYWHDTIGSALLQQHHGSTLDWLRRATDQ